MEGFNLNLESYELKGSTRFCDQISDSVLRSKLFYGMGKTHLDLLLGFSSSVLTKTVTKAMWVLFSQVQRGEGVTKFFIDLMCIISMIIPRGGPPKASAWHLTFLENTVVDQN